MTDKPLGIAIAGMGDFGTKCLEALADVEAFHVVGIADREADRAEQAAAAVGAEPFSDCRQLLQQLRPDVLLVATSPAPAADLVRLAAKTGSHVIKAAPMARTLDEAVELVRLMGAAGRHFAVLAPRRCYESYRSLLTHHEQLGRLFLGRAAYVLNWDPRLGWRADRASAGGGVLLEAGYQMIDLMVTAMGLPEEVYAVTGRGGRPHMVETDGEVESKGIYDTDDTAVVTLRYGANGAGSVVASWVTSPANEHLILHGQRGSGSATADHCVFRDVDGQVVERIEGDDRPRKALTTQLTHMAAAFAGRTPTCPSTAAEHLLTMAVIEAAYLSDRTGHPESPARLLETRDISPDSCLPRPPQESSQSSGAHSPSDQ